MSFAIVAYPLSTGYRERFEAAIADQPEYLALQELRRLSPLRAARVVFALRGRVCYLPMEDEGSEALLPILGLIAAIGAASRIVVVRNDLSRDIVPKTKAWRVALALIGASVRDVWVAVVAWRELRHLLASSPQAVAARAGRRVLYLNSNLWFGVKAGGSVGHVAGVVNALGRAGFGVELWSATEPIMVRPPARTFRLEPLPAFGLPLELNYYAFQRRMVRQLRRKMPSADVAFLYQRLSVGNYAGVVLARHLRVPLVLEYNGSEVWIARKWGRPLRFEGLAALAEDVSLHQASLVVTVSEVLRDEIVARGVDPARVVWHANGIDPDVFDPGRFSADDRAALRTRYRLRPEDVVVTFVGTFGRWHGAEVLARAIAGLAAREARWLEERRVRFLFVGDGLRMPDVQRELAAGPTQPFVRFAGLVPQADAPRYLAFSDILVAPHVANVDGSPFFGSPTKLFEYMAMGKAILASDLDQIGDVIRPALRAMEPPVGPPAEDQPEVGMLATPGDTDDLERGLRSLVEQPAWRTRLGANARAVALARYTWDDHVAAILEQLAALAGGARAP